MTEYEIGEWTFTPARNELARDGETRPLEFRAARVLECLCAQRGEVISRDDLIAAVWQGRSLSEHTVAVVISDLRKALEDDVRQPRFIETVAKRGYRLLPDVADAAPPPVERSSPESPSAPKPAAPMFVSLVVVALLLLSAAAWTGARGRGEPRTIITVNNIENASGVDAYGALAVAVDEFSADYLSKADGSLLIRDFNDGQSWKTSKTLERWFGRETIVYHLSGRIIIDAGAPYVSLAVADGRDWTIIWTATAPIGDDGVARILPRTLDGFLAAVGISSKVATPGV